MMERKTGAAGSSGEQAPGFNGAAPMMERKTEGWIDGARGWTALQWGRSDDGAENRRSRRSGDGSARFNGAAPMMERKTSASVNSDAGHEASMGPLR